MHLFLWYAFVRPLGLGNNSNSTLSYFSTFSAITHFLKIMPSLDEIYNGICQLPVPILVLAGLLFLYAFYDLISATRRNLRKDISVAEGWPILGNIFDFYPSVVIQTALEYPKKYGTLAVFFFLNQKKYLTSDPEIIHEVFLKRPKKFRRRRREEYAGHRMGFINGLFNVNDEWPRIRKATAPSFSNLNIKHKFPVIIQEIEEFIQRLKTFAIEQKSIDGKFESFGLTIRVTSLVAFGLPASDPRSHYFFTSQFLEDVINLFRFSAEYRMFALPQWCWQWSPSYKYETVALQGIARFDAAVNTILQYKRQLVNREDVEFKPTAMIDHLLVRESVHTADALTDREIISNCKTFYVAGAETTSVAITWSIYILAEYPDIRDQIRNEVATMLFNNNHKNEGTTSSSSSAIEFPTVTIDQLPSLVYCHAFAKEILRMYSPAFIGPMELTNQSEAVILSSASATYPPQFILYPGEEIWLNLEAAMKDEKVFANALSFQPERWLTTDEALLLKMEHSFFAFGGGPRTCPGIHLAMTELILAIAYLAFYFDIALDCPKDEIKRIFNFAAAANKMPVKLTLRDHTN
jgi:cytochrome P450